MLIGQPHTLLTSLMPSGTWCMTLLQQITVLSKVFAPAAGLWELREMQESST